MADPTPLFVKDPADQRTIWWGWVDALGAGNQIFGQPVVSVSPGDATLAVPSVNDVQLIKQVVDPETSSQVAKTFPPKTLVQSMLSGGTAGQIYTCTCRVFSSSGEILSRSFLVQCATR